MPPTISPATFADLHAAATLADPSDLETWGIDEVLWDCDGIKIADYSARFVFDAQASGWIDEDTIYLVGTIEISVHEGEIQGPYSISPIRLTGGKLHYPFEAEIDREHYPGLPSPNGTGPLATP